MSDTERMRILILSGQLGEGGAPKVILNVVKHLRHAVDDITVGYLSGRGDLASEFAAIDIPVVRLGDGVTDPDMPLSLWRLISTYRPTVLHTHMVSAAGLGRVIGRLRGIPVVSTIHTSYGNRSAPARALDLSTSFLPAANVSVSNAVAASLPSSFGIGAKSEIIHNCVDTEDLRTKGAVPWDDVSWNEGISQDQPIIANVSRFDPKKRKADLVRALPSIQEEFPDAAVVLTGWGEHRRHVEQVVSSLGVEEDVFFVGHVQNPYSVYHHADVVAFPSLSEGFSIGMLEAMTFGKPIVATEIPPFREALGAEHPLVPPSDPPALADAVRRYLRDPEQARRAGERAKERVERNFSGRAAAQAYLAVYNAVCS